MTFETEQAAAQFIIDSEARFPIPKWDSDRLPKRRWVLEHLELAGIGAEIGVFRGQFSRLICEVAQPKKLYLIDPWTSLGETFGWGKEYTSFGRLTTLAAKQETQARTMAFASIDKIMIEGQFPTCGDQIKDPLDWAYLDASHKFQPTLNELQALDERIKPNGFILGDDWDPKPDSAHHGVFQAVHHFVKERPWDLIKSGPGRQWILRRRSI
ncbi:MAG: class I SAM-dependent methyltransferase [Paracoccaceae bacterium]